MVMHELRYEVLVHDGVRRHRAQRLPDGSPIVSSPLASTLILGEHDAVLVDPPFALRPRAVVAGHKNKDLPDDPAILGQTRRYLVDAQRLLDEKPTPQEFFDRTLALYPDRLNPGPVWYGTLGLLS